MGLTLVFVIVMLDLGPTAISSVLTVNVPFTVEPYVVTRWPEKIVDLVLALIPSVYMASILGVTAITISRTVKAAAVAKGARPGLTS